VAEAVEGAGEPEEKEQEEDGEDKEDKDNGTEDTEDKNREQEEPAPDSFDDSFDDEPDQLLSGSAPPAVTEEEAEQSFCGGVPESESESESEPEPDEAAGRPVPATAGRGEVWSALQGVPSAQLVHLAFDVIVLGSNAGLGRSLSRRELRDSPLGGVLARVCWPELDGGGERSVTREEWRAHVGLGLEATLGADYRAFLVDLICAAGADVGHLLPINAAGITQRALDQHAGATSPEPLPEVASPGTPEARAMATAGLGPGATAPGALPAAIKELSPRAMALSTLPAAVKELSPISMGHWAAAMPEGAVGHAAGRAAGRAADTSAGIVEEAAVLASSSSDDGAQGGPSKPQPERTSAAVDALPAELSDSSDEAAAAAAAHETVSGDSPGPMDGWGAPIDTEDTNFLRLPDDADPGAGVYRCLSDAGVTPALELTSPDGQPTVVRRCKQGEAIDILRVATTARGQRRGRVADGWVSLVAGSGKVLLRPLPRQAGREHGSSSPPPAVSATITRIVRKDNSRAAVLAAAAGDRRQVACDSRDTGSSDDSSSDMDALDHIFSSPPSVPASSSPPLAVNAAITRIVRLGSAEGEAVAGRGRAGQLAAVGALPLAAIDQEAAEVDSPTGLHNLTCLWRLRPEPCVCESASIVIQGGS
jgi:hypothetical protein